uniref:G-protein coupled receptors family 1 profile domain-containing protein n=1 Tax=Meloidogyne javanica TaxID=6303 RepID=A0A915MSR4_MELJA
MDLMSSTIPPNKTPLQELDSSTAINLLRYIIALNALFTNGFLLYLFVRYKRYRALRGTQCNLFIAANAAVEFIIGIGLALRATFELIAMSMSIHSFTHTLCVLIGSPLTGGFAANQVTILGLALDRLTAVAWPFTYGKKNKLTILVALILLVYSICWALPTAICVKYLGFLIVSETGHYVLDPKDLTRINYVTFIQGFITPLGAGINLYIYIWKHAEIRRSARDTIPFLKQILHDKTFTNPNT